MSIPNPGPSSARRRSLRASEGRRRPRSKFRPILAGLETRSLLSTLVVSNLGDGIAGSLRAEIAASKPGDVIAFAPSAYGTIDLAGGPLEVSKSIRILGPGAGQVTVNGGGKSSVFAVDAGVTATISGLTITGGQSIESAFGGGGVTNQGNLTLADDRISGNASYAGAGVASATGSLTIVGSTISGNSASGDGGGIEAGGYNVSGTAGPLTIVGSSLSGNTANNGGGLFDSGGSVTIVGSSLSGNTATVLGGGIDSSGTSSVSMTLVDSTISGNSAAIEGGIRAYGENVSHSHRLKEPGP